jgi:hypothetical protein
VVEERKVQTGQQDELRHKQGGDLDPQARPNSGRFHFPFFFAQLRSLHPITASTAAKAANVQITIPKNQTSPIDMRHSSQPKQFASVMGGRSA